MSKLDDFNARLTNDGGFRKKVITGCVGICIIGGIITLVTDGGGNVNGNFNITDGGGVSVNENIDYVNKSEQDEQAKQEEEQKREEQAKAAEEQRQLEEALDKKMPKEDAQRAMFLSFVNGLKYDTDVTDWHDLIRWSNYNDQDRSTVYKKSNGDITYVDDVTWHIEDMHVDMYHPDNQLNVVPGEYVLSGDVKLTDDDIYHVTFTKAEYNNPDALSEEYAKQDYLDMIPSQDSDGAIVYDIHKEMVE